MTHRSQYKNPPYFLICGTQKGGTRALISYLKQHPDIYCHPRELNFFTFRYRKGIKWYMKQFRKAKDGQIWGEKSPQYMYVKYAPERIKKHLPHVKLIFILRNPAERAYSHYWMNRLKGKEKRRNFSHLIREYEDSPEPCIHNYISRGFYDEQIARFSKYFDDDQMLIISSNSLRYNRISCLHKITDFLGVDDMNPSDIQIIRKGVGGMPKYRLLTWILSKKYIQLFPRLRTIIQTLNKGKKYPKMKYEDYEYLRKLYETKSTVYLASKP